MNKIYKLMDWLEAEIVTIKHESNLSTDDTEVLEYDGALFAMRKVINKVREIYAGNF